MIYELTITRQTWDEVGKFFRTNSERVQQFENEDEARRAFREHHRPIPNGGRCTQCTLMAIDGRRRTVLLPAWAEGVRV